MTKKEKIEALDKNIQGCQQILDDKDKKINSVTIGATFGKLEFCLAHLIDLFERNKKVLETEIMMNEMLNKKEENA